MSSSAALGAPSVPYRWLHALSEAIEASPSKAFVVFTLLHLVLWTAVPSILCSNLPQDVIEGIAYGKGWQIGYWKHPALPWWLDAAVLDLVGPQVWAFFLLGQITVVLAFWGLWRLGCALLTPLEALIAIILLDGCVVFNILAMEFNHNIVQLPIWAFAAFFLYRAFLNGRVLDWIAVGALLALAFYAKYTAITLVVPLVLFALLEPQARRCWSTIGPYVAMVVFAVVLAPQAIWALRTSFGPVGFWTEFAKPVGGLGELLWQTFDFTVNAVLLLVPTGLLCMILHGTIWRPAYTIPPSEHFKRRFVFVLTFGPIGMLIGVHLLLARHMESGWAAPYWTFFGLFLITDTRNAIPRAAIARLVIAWIVMTAGFIGSQIAAQVYHVHADIRWATHFPGQAMAATMTDTWRRETGTPLSYVIGDFWLAGNLVTYSPDHPAMLHDGVPNHSPWIDEDDLRRRGGILIWDWRLGVDRLPDFFVGSFVGAKLQRPLILRIPAPGGEHIWTVPWALLPPSPGPAAAPAK